jgi:hypothetical protein
MQASPKGYRNSGSSFERNKNICYSPKKRRIEGMGSGEWGVVKMYIEMV